MRDIRGSGGEAGATLLLDLMVEVGRDGGTAGREEAGCDEGVTGCDEVEAGREEVEAGHEEMEAGHEEVEAGREEVGAGGGDREVGVWSTVGDISEGRTTDLGTSDARLTASEV